MHKKGRDPLQFETPAEEREFQIYYAKVMLREARARRGTPFSATLLSWAAKARRRAQELARMQGRPGFRSTKSTQGELF